MNAELNFIRQQGFPDATTDSCPCRYPALMWQPRIIAALLLPGVLLQPWGYFQLLGMLLWWNAAAPGLNPFDALYNFLVAKPGNLPLLGPAPAPRRFAQAMAGTFMLAIGTALMAGLDGLAWLLEAVLLTAVAALVFGRFCLGSYLFHLARGQASFANRTLPWSRADEPR
ncbi:MAG: DUF4395 domain-containing protein [Desulfobulbaceae bacterium]|nr:MAG: DUF4395 domain-containing protein [Desulfobulbaceae bacterium]